ncbi:hypothetical protein HDE_11190 [Halotydeus destructor]|nr:hypothetical protein HDE_11190 [Halotydeus destructor]
MLKLTSISKLFDSIRKNTSDEDMTECRKLTKILIRVLVSEIIVSTMTQCVIHYMYHRDVITVADMLIYCASYVMESWVDCAVASYIYFFCHIYFLDKSRDLQVWRRLRTHNMANKPVDYGYEIAAKKQLDDLKTTFDRKFGIILVNQLYAYLFSTTITLALKMRRSGETLMYELPYHLKYTIFSLTLFGFICYAQDKMKLRREALVRYLMTTDRNISPGTHALTTELSNQVPFTGLRQFTVEPSLLLAFIGSLISFTVLLLQIAN